MSDTGDWIPSAAADKQPLLRSRTGKPRSVPSTAAEDESFAGVSIRREALRQANHRDSDRHRLDNVSVDLLHAGRRQTVTLVNLSGGGAMIEGVKGLQLWDEVTLVLGDCGKVSAAVRWARGNRIGLEFAQETRIDGHGADLMLVTAAFHNFSDAAQVAGLEAIAACDSIPDRAGDNQDRASVDNPERELRHAFIWSGKIHYDYETIPVRLRNISQGGALIECGRDLAIDAELLLELDKAGTFFATVKWIGGDTAGLRFHQPFDLQCLASAKAIPAQARWIAPDYLRGSSGGSLWERRPPRTSALKQQRRVFHG